MAGLIAGIFFYFLFNILLLLESKETLKFKKSPRWKRITIRIFILLFGGIVIVIWVIREFFRYLFS